MSRSRSGGGFPRATFDFLEELAEHNERTWFDANRQRYEDHVREPALALIEAFAPRLRAISPHFHAGPRSLFRIHRDVRFSPDKSPFKTHVGIQFRHDAGRDVHAPGYYLHIEPGGCFAALGMWRPGREALRAVRDRIVEEADAWEAASRRGSFAGTFRQEGDRLKRGPRDFPADHPRIEDLKWKDFVGVRDLPRRTVTGRGFAQELGDLFEAGAPFMRFLCGAVGVAY